MARFWYSYVSGDERVPSSYSLADVTPTCLNGPQMCAIYATGGGETPNAFSQRLQNYIANALITKIAQPQDTNTFKKYVYVKSAQ